MADPQRKALPKGRIGHEKPAEAGDKSKESYRSNKCLIDFSRGIHGAIGDSLAELRLNGKAVVDMGKHRVADGDQRHRIEGDKGISRLPLGGEGRVPPQPSAGRP